MISSFRKKYIGDRAFYARTLALLIPMVLQNLITNFVSMLDNIMVGQVGTEQMSGVSIANQFVFIFNITIFGAVSGPGIFGAQFFGKGDHEGQKYTVRYRIGICSIVIAIFAFIFFQWHDELISLYLSADDAPEISAATLGYARDYMMVIILSLIPFGIGQAYSSVVRECGETKIPMYGSLAAVGINLLLDYGLIFGKLGMPELGVVGAAWATVIAKFVEAGVVVLWAHIKPEKNKYVVGLYKSMRIPKPLFKDILIKGTPLLFNEFLWVISISLIAQCYSTRGLDVVAARNIGGTLTNLFNVVYIQMGACIAIMLGNVLGAGRKQEAIAMSKKLIFFSIFLSVLVGILAIPFAFFFPAFYNTTDQVKGLATFIILITALAMPVWAYTNACYFTLRSGGKTGITFIFDFSFSWFIMIPIGFILAYLTDIDFYWLFGILTFSEIIKCIIGFFMVRSNIWVQTIVN